MTTYDDAWVKAEEAKRAWLDANGLYRAEDEHSSCGVGLVVAISGKLMLPKLLAEEAKVKSPIMLIHGDRDDVVPFQEMQAAGNALVAAGFATFGHVMQGTGHGIAPDGLGVAMQFLKERLPG